MGLLYQSLTDSLAHFKQQKMVLKWQDSGETDCRHVIWNHLMTTVECGGGCCKYGKEKKENTVAVHIKVTDLLVYDVVKFGR
jgi:hypothetical protein